jgi:hypothetical protein
MQEAESAQGYRASEVATHRSKGFCLFLECAKQIGRNSLGLKEFAKGFLIRTDYDRSITKSFEKKKSAGSSSDVPQLGAQKKQSIPPIMVLPADQQGLLDFLGSSGLSTTEVAGRKEIAIHPELLDGNKSLARALFLVNSWLSFQRKYAI